MFCVFVFGCFVCGCLGALTTCVVCVGGWVYELVALGLLKIHFVWLVV